MDSFEFNKVAGGVLGTALLVMALSIGSELIFEQPAPEKPGFIIKVAEGGGGETPPPAAIEPIAVRLQTADVKAGAQTAKACLTCHSLEKGQPAKIGPNLWGVVGGPAAHMAGFGYSQAMQERAKEGKTWTFEELDKFLANPQGDVPGTAMTFPGVKDPKARANVIAYIRTLSDSPVPLPPPPPAGAAPAGAEPAKPAPAGAAPAEPAKPAAPAGAAPAEPAKPAEPAPAPAQ